MTSNVQKNQRPIPGVEFYKDGATTTKIERASSSNSNENNRMAQQPEVKQQTMTKAVWLACIGLGLAYTTAFQQNACTTAIVKHIDDELGKAFSNKVKSF
jgi:hypothetical protein